MKLLSRPEELFLLAIWKLQDNAYAVTIRDQVNRITGKTWSFGATFVTLDRLVQKRYLTSYLSAPTQKRGGRSKRMYQLTREGVKALLDIKKLQESMWNDIPRLSLSEVKK
ncbi:MAG: helix-turn-helix transcriptional regulator [Candidatus Aminicenantes bacterium]|nr:helix-turn-helix transcriptional regulator [Candidatus Aminicenantes bacterium]